MGLGGESWFVAADVINALGLMTSKGAYNYVRSLDDDEKQKVNTQNKKRGNTNLVIIAESGLYKIILRAHRSNPQARKFQDWVTKVVLPAIRKDGAYVMG